jgi:hypothetical protein
MQLETETLRRTAPARAPSCAARPRLSRARRHCSRCARTPRAAASFAQPAATWCLS